MENDTEENVVQPDDGELSNKSPLEKAEYYINRGELLSAQETLNSVKEKSGKKYYLQSRIYKEKFWYNEQRKQLKKAVKADPSNAEYKYELEELEEFSKTPAYKSMVRKQQMGDICSEGGTECCCLCLCEGICPNLDGC